jgi:type II secretory pathway pseudopilin PulG
MMIDIKNKNKLIKGNKSGLTIIETLAVLGIAALVIVGGLVLFVDAQNALKATAAMTEITAITTELNTEYSNEVSTDLNNRVAITSGFIPSNTKKLSNADTGVIKSKLGGEYVIAGSSTGSNDFSLTINGLDSTEKCLTAYKSSTNLTYDRVDINGTVRLSTEWTKATASVSCDGTTPATVILYKD